MHYSNETNNVREAAIGVIITVKPIPQFGKIILYCMATVIGVNECLNVDCIVNTIPRFSYFDLTLVILNNSFQRTCT